jgi:hypothetical protein
LGAGGIAGSNPVAPTNRPRGILGFARPWSNGIRHESSKLEDGGSSPSGRMVDLHFAVTVAQLVRASVCGTEGRGSESRQSPQDRRRTPIEALRTSDEANEASERAPLAQSVEQRPFKPLVPGSSPGGRTAVHR